MDGYADELGNLAPTFARLSTLMLNYSLTDDDRAAILFAVKVIGFVGQPHIMPQLNSYLLNFPNLSAAQEQRLRECGIDIDDEDENEES